VRPRGEVGPPVTLRGRIVAVPAVEHDRKEAVATAAEVETTLVGLLRRLERLDASTRALLPTRRIVEARFPDLDLVYHTHVRDGEPAGLHTGPAPRPHIRVSCHSDDLIAVAAGQLAFRRAYATNRIRLQASMSDLLRLRGVL
jgi:hypothetical protein